MTQAQIIALYNPVLRSIASKLVHCKADVDDLVQDTFLKWLSVDTNKIKNTKAYLMRAVVNNSLNHLKSLKKKREEYFDTFRLPDVVLKVKELDISHLDMQKDVRAALNVLQNKLEPLERAVYLLREVFSFEYEDLQETFTKTQGHCRQIVSRAKKKLIAETQKIKANYSNTTKWKGSFEKACHFGFLDELIGDLQKDANLSLT